MVIALIVTPEGFPLAYEVLPGNAADTTTLEDFLCIAPGSLDTSLSHAAGLSDIAGSHA